MQAFKHELKTGVSMKHCTKINRRKQIVATQTIIKTLNLPIFWLPDVCV